MPPTVSVVIVTYNKQDTVAASIESVLRQTVRDLEILVVDDGSTDQTPQRVKAFGDQVRLFRKSNGGTGSARNLGIAEARGRYVAFLDGDDLWFPRKLEIQMAAFDREPDILAVQCSAYCVNDRLEVLEARACRPHQDTLLDFLLFHNLPAFSSALVVRKDALENLGGFATDLVILSDWDMACRLARKGTLRSVPDLLVLYRHYPGNQSRNVAIHVESGIRSLKRLFSDPTLDPQIRRRELQVWARLYAMVAGGYVRNRRWALGLQWAIRALRTSVTVSPYVVGLPVRKIRRAFDMRRGISFVREFSYAVNPPGLS